MKLNNSEAEGLDHDCLEDSGIDLVIKKIGASYLRYYEFILNSYSDAQAKQNKLEELRGELLICVNEYLIDDLQSKIQAKDALELAKARDQLREELLAIIRNLDSKQGRKVTGFVKIDQNIVRLEDQNLKGNARIIDAQYYEDLSHSTVNAIFDFFATQTKK